jgi:hypothetical protein
MRSKLANRSRDDDTAIENTSASSRAGDVLRAALEAYLAASLTGTPIAPPALDRIDVVP